MKVSDEEFSMHTKNSYSIACLCRKLGIRPLGGNYKTVKARIKKLGLDTSHFTGQAHNRGKKLPRCGKPLDEILVQDSSYTSTNHLKQRLIKDGVKDAVCEECKLSMWNEKPIPLELEHINGVNTDHRLENLKILCPNCHAQTDCYRGRNKTSALSEKKEVEAFKFGEVFGNDNPEPSRKSKGVETLRRQPKSNPLCVDCGSEITHGAKRCRFCDYQIRTSKTRPSVFELLKDFEELKSFVAVARKYGVSDQAVHKWVKLYKIEDMVKRKSSAQTN